MPFTLLSPSRRERGVRQVACLLATACAAVLLAAAWRADPFDPLPALAVPAVLAIAWMAGRRVKESAVELGIDNAGQLVARWADDSEARVWPLRCVFAAPWLITARNGSLRVALWPDAVPGNVFRRFWVHIRWSRAGRAADPVAAAAPGQAR